MPDIDPENPANLLAFEAFNDRVRAALVSRLKEQFTEDAAVGMCDAGNTELGGPLHDAPPSGTAASFQVQFTQSALNDWECFSAGTQQTLLRAIDELRAGLGAGNGVLRLSRNDCFLLRRGPMRCVYRRNAANCQVVVFGFGVWAINPLQKIWRYFSQDKAEDLVRTSELYLRRLDRLLDAFEATPTFAMYEDHRRALVGSMGFAADHHLDFFDHLRRALYVSCWQKSEHESFAMWKGYCPDDGGFAIQTTERRLHHEHRRISRSKNHFHLKSVRYVDHASEPAFLRDISDPAFLKASWYSDEKEIRFAAMRIDAAAGGTAEQTEERLNALPDHERIAFDLNCVVEHVVFNPFSRPERRASLVELIRTSRAVLESRIAPSALEGLPGRRAREM